MHKGKKKKGGESQAFHAAQENNSFFRCSELQLVHSETQFSCKKYYSKTLRSV